jgi:hypothetical protein
MAQDKKNETISNGSQTAGYGKTVDNKNADRVGTHGNKHSEIHSEAHELNSDTRAGITKGRAAEYTDKQGMISQQNPKLNDKH